MVSKCTFLGILASIVIPTNVQCAILHILHNYFSQIPLVFAVPQDRKSAMCIKLIFSQPKFLSSSISVGFWCHFPKNHIKTEPASKEEVWTWTGHLFPVDLMKKVRHFAVCGDILFGQVFLVVASKNWDENNRLKKLLLFWSFTSIWCSKNWKRNWQNLVKHFSWNNQVQKIIRIENNNFLIEDI